MNVEERTTYMRLLRIIFIVVISIPGFCVILRNDLEVTIVCFAAAVTVGIDTFLLNLDW